jgi:hypothetical protein
MSRRCLALFQNHRLDVLANISRLATPPRSIHSTRTLDVTVRTSRRSYQTSRPTHKNSADLEKSKDINKAMGDVLGNQTAATTSRSRAEIAEAERGRKARHQQSIINATVSFFTIILAAQAVKSASDRRKAERALKDALEITDETRQALKTIQSDDVIRELAQKCCRATTERSEKSLPPPGSGTSRWFGGTAALPKEGDEDDDSKGLEGRIFEILQMEITRRVGHASMTEEEKDKSKLKQMQKERISDLLGDELLKEMQSIQMIKDEKSGTTVVKRRVFTI